MSTFTFDPAHSSVEFVVKHMMFAKVRGYFTSVNVTLDVDDATNVPTSISADIDAASINTNVADRDAHLRSQDFLHVEAFPKITYRSTGVTGTADNFTVNGELTIHGKSLPVALRGACEGRAKDPWGNDRIAFSAHAKINRKDFGLTWNQALEAGGVLVGEEIDIQLAVEATKAQTAAAV